MPADATSDAGPQGARVRAVRDRLARERRRFDDAVLDVRLARGRWEAQPHEDHRLALIDELSVGILLGRNHVLCLDDLRRLVDTEEAAAMAAAGVTAMRWIVDATNLLHRIGHSGRS